MKAARLPPTHVDAKNRLALLPRLPVAKPLLGGPSVLPARSAPLKTKLWPIKELARQVAG